MKMTAQKVFDAYLVLQYQSGNKKALGLLVDRYHDKMCRQSFWYTRDIEVSKDIVQDCWGIIMLKLNGLRDANSFGSWALRIVTRKSIDFLNRNRYGHRNLDNPAAEPLDSTDVAAQESDLKKLDSAIRDLPENHQVVLRLFYTQEYSLQEIGAILDVSVGTVKSRLFHAREKLKTILKT
tara:strand:- start:1138 stop:1677 length:540 start_codon:yes stop_codon:yes gene_type:complete